ncbi:MAG: UvrD-helicase domain-containing protein [Candidatus Moranbacteria bacterium]|nr:UvrD-helicase domain-containing protein [Candidatus Moranbacteria bacterium]
MSKNLLDELNEKQQIAVVQTEGPVLVLAGAGSGKTRALTYRVAYLIQEKGVNPRNILAVTFTNKAAGEMRERIKELLNLPPDTSPYSSKMPHVGTFHSICVRILRQEIDQIGYNKNFIIYDDRDQLALIKKVMKELDISEEKIKAKAVLGTISKAKSNLINAEEFNANVSSYYEELAGNVYLKYQGRLEEANAVDFDDIIMLMVKIFDQYPKVLDKYQEIFRYIMVDEYQDTNQTQYIFLKNLASKYGNICVVGDDWQSIYGWRQANIRNILEFEKDYSNAKVILLEQNYRSTKNILDAAHCVIEKNVNQKKKKLWTKNEDGELIAVLEVENEKKEANQIVKEIKRAQKEDGETLSDFAILYRTNAQSRALEEAFLKQAIPYKIVGGLKFYQRREVKDILAYLCFLTNPSDEINFERIINQPARGLGKKTVEKLIQCAQDKGVSLLEVVNSGDLVEYKINAGKLKTLNEFGKLIKNIRRDRKKLTVSELINKIYVDSGYRKMLLKEGDEGEVRHENIQELLTVAQKFDGNKEDDLANFLEEVALVSQTDQDLEEQDSVLLMTLHSAKGLEFNRVFLVGMEEGLFPHSRSIINPSEMEEERRLCYVGITRAKKKAYLFFTNYRNIYGSTQASVKSRFLEEIDQELIEQEMVQEDLDSGFYEDPTLLEEDPFEPSSGIADLKDGDRVSHPDFGNGMVVSKEGDLVTVAFPKLGLRKLSVKFAPLTKK